MICEQKQNAHCFSQILDVIPEMTSDKSPSGASSHVRGAFC